MTNKADCKSGTHSLITIYKNRKGYDEEEVVRWCTKCGSVVVDIDYDNRTYPGKVVKMKIPESLYNQKVRQVMIKASEVVKTIEDNHNTKMVETIKDIEAKVIKNKENRKLTIEIKISEKEFYEKVKNELEKYEYTVTIEEVNIDCDKGTSWYTDHYKLIVLW